MVHHKPENEKMYIAWTMEVFGKGAKQRISILKGQVEESMWLAENNAGVNTAEVYGKFKNKIRECRADLQALNAEERVWLWLRILWSQRIQGDFYLLQRKGKLHFEELQKKIIQQQPSTITTESLSRHYLILSQSTPCDSSSRHSSTLPDNAVSDNDEEAQGKV
jgi:hypothetical protein